MKIFLHFFIKFSYEIQVKTHIDRFLWNELSGINADSEQSLAVWNRTRKIINEMDLELDENQPPKYQPSIKKIIIKPDPNEPTESKSLD